MPNYSINVEYKDILSNTEEAATETMDGQIEEMRKAFCSAFKD